MKAEESKVFFTPQEVDTIKFVGNRYNWSDKALEHMSFDDDGWGIIEVSEAVIYSIHESIENDMEGGHNAFPMLNTRDNMGSQIATKLLLIYNQAI